MPSRCVDDIRVLGVLVVIDGAYRGIRIQTERVGEVFKERRKYCR